MKPVAIASTLLLHAAAIGTVVHLHSSQGSDQSRSRPFEISLLSSPRMATAITPNIAKPVVGPVASKQFIEVDQSIKQQEISDSTKAQVASPDPSSPPASPVKSGVSIPATYVDSNRKPVYPLLSRRQEEQGIVLLRIMVKADGTAGQIVVRKTSGFPLLDESALSAVQYWRFNPASIDNKPIAEWYQVAIPFTLHN